MAQLGEPRVREPAEVRLGNSWRWAAMVSVAIAVGSYYLWNVRITGNRFAWGGDLGGYYDYLGRAFADGQLHLPIAPSPKLLALPNPWDPSVDDSYRMHDMALFHGRYYLYHGAGPAVILFAPWRLVTGHDLPEPCALVLLCFGGYLFSCGALLRLLDLGGARPGTPLLAVMLFALGMCQGVPYLLNRVWVYEIAIGGGYFAISGAVFFLARGILSRRSPHWLAASGLMFGLAIACRPHLGLAGVIALAGLVIYHGRSRGPASALASREVVAFVVPLFLAGAAVAGYNYCRFGNPFEFGLRYLLTGPNANHIGLSARNVVPGFYYFLFCPPDFSPVFPWVRLMFRHPFDSLEYPFPPVYFIEPIVGALWAAPFVIGGLFIGWRGRDGWPNAALWIMLAASGAIFLFLAATGFTTERYEVDFVPLVVLTAVTVFGIRIARSAGVGRTALSAILVVSVAYSAVANLALGIAGPYDEMLKNRPVNYLRIARWFSPVERFRPILNPDLDVEFTARFTRRPDGVREPLVTIGYQAYRHFVYVEHQAGKLRIVSRSDSSTVAHEIGDPGRQPVTVRVTYAPGSGNLAVAINGEAVLVHQIGTLVTAPAQVTAGENRIDHDLTEGWFSGRIEAPRQSVKPSAISARRPGVSR